MWLVSLTVQVMFLQRKESRWPLLHIITLLLNWLGVSFTTQMTWHIWTVASTVTWWLSQVEVKLLALYQEAGQPGGSRLLNREGGGPRLPRPVTDRRIQVRTSTSLPRTVPKSVKTIRICIFTNSRGVLSAFGQYWVRFFYFVRNVNLCWDSRNYSMHFVLSFCKDDSWPSLFIQCVRWLSSVSSLFHRLTFLTELWKVDSLNLRTVIVHKLFTSMNSSTSGLHWEIKLPQFLEKLWAQICSL